MDNIREKLVELLREVQYLGGLEEKIADHLIRHGVTVQEWIPVTERLPEDYLPVLVYKTGPDESYGNVDSAYRSMGRWVGCIGLYVTHWMPLPTPPKGE